MSLLKTFRGVVPLVGRAKSSRTSGAPALEEQLVPVRVNKNGVLYVDTGQESPSTRQPDSDSLTSDVDAQNSLTYLYGFDGTRWDRARLYQQNLVQARQIDYLINQGDIFLFNKRTDISNGSDLDIVIQAYSLFVSQIIVKSTQNVDVTIFEEVAYDNGTGTTHTPIDINRDTANDPILNNRIWENPTISNDGNEIVESMAGPDFSDNIFGPDNNDKIFFDNAEDYLIRISNNSGESARVALLYKFQQID